MLLVSLTVGCVQTPCSGEKVGFGQATSLPIEKDFKPSVFQSQDDQKAQLHNILNR